MMNIVNIARLGKIISAAQRPSRRLLRERAIGAGVLKFAINGSDSCVTDTAPNLPGRRRFFVNQEEYSACLRQEVVNGRLSLEPAVPTSS
jgi:hypothetical protein